MTVNVYFREGQPPAVFKDAKASTSTSRTDSPADLYIYRGDERIAHFVAGAWLWWANVDQNAPTT